jgi:hypothetical protein
MKLGFGVTTMEELPLLAMHTDVEHWKASVLREHDKRIAHAE